MKTLGILLAGLPALFCAIVAGICWFVVGYLLPVLETPYLANALLWTGMAVVVPYTLWDATK